MSSEWTIGVVGGSGVYAIDGLEDPKWIAIDTPWGAPSDELLTGRIEGVKFVFLPRHGRGHRISPTELNARANIDALKRAGCTDVISLSAIGSLQEHLPPGKFVVIDQFVDRTFARVKSFFGTGCVAHVSVADPVCPRLSAMLAAAGRAVGADMHEGATQLVMEGPQFSTRAESRLYRQWGCDVIGMTAMPEAKLAREAELPYAVVGMVTDYDSWREGEGHVEVDEVIAQLIANSGLAKQLVVEFARSLPAERTPSPIDRALDVALMTAPEKRDPALMAKLDAITARVLGAR